MLWLLALSLQTVRHAKHFYKMKLQWTRKFIHMTGLYLLISFLRGILVKSTFAGSSILPNTRSTIPMPSFTLLVRNFVEFPWLILQALIVCKEFWVFILMSESNSQKGDQLIAWRSKHFAFPMKRERSGFTLVMVLDALVSLFKEQLFSFFRYYFVLFLSNIIEILRRTAAIAIASSYYQRERMTKCLRNLNWTSSERGFDFLSRSEDLLRVTKRL